MVLTPERFVITDFGFGTGVLLITLGVLSLLRGNTAARRSTTGTVVAIGSLFLGSYIVARYYGYQI